MTTGPSIAIKAISTKKPLQQDTAEPANQPKPPLLDKDLAVRPRVGTGGPMPARSVPLSGGTANAREQREKEKEWGQKRGTDPRAGRDDRHDANPTLGVVVERRVRDGSDKRPNEGTCLLDSLMAHS
jgi:hypothetical protein